MFDIIFMICFTVFMCCFFVCLFVFDYLKEKNGYYDRTQVRIMRQKLFNQRLKECKAQTKSSKL